MTDKLCPFGGDGIGHIRIGTIVIGLPNIGNLPSVVGGQHGVSQFPIHVATAVVFFPENSGKAVLVGVPETLEGTRYILGDGIVSVDGHPELFGLVGNPVVFFEFRFKGEGQRQTDDPEAFNIRVFVLGLVFRIDILVVGLVDFDVLRQSVKAVLGAFGNFSLEFFVLVAFKHILDGLTQRHGFRSIIVQVIIRVRTSHHIRREGDTDLGREDVDCREMLIFELQL